MEKRDQNRVNRILESADGLQKAHAPEYFYTRLNARMQNEWEGRRKPFILLRPAFVMTAMFIVILANLVSLSLIDNKTVQQKDLSKGKSATIESFAAAYNLESSNVYE